MNWIKFSDQFPEEGGKVITRSPGWNRDENFIDDWRVWDKTFMQLKPHAPTHWWNGVDDFDLALENWYKFNQ